MFSRRNAFLGWLVWTLAKRKLRKRVGQAAATGSPRRGRLRRLVTVVAGLLALVAAARRRSASAR